MQNQNANRDALLQALSSGQAYELFSDSQLNELIEAEFSKPVEKMDCEVLDAYYQLLERRHSPFTRRQIARSERKNLRRFKRFMKHSRDDETQRNVFHFKPIVLTALVFILILAPALIKNKDFRVSIAPDEQRYVVVGVRKNNTGIARANVSEDVEDKEIKLDSVDQIAQELGYFVALPNWIPDGYQLSTIRAARNVQYDDVKLTYSDGKERINIEVLFYSDRSGIASSYEQDATGKHVILSSGASIYLSRNMRSTWGLYQSSYVDYLIYATKLNENEIVRMFSSMEEMWSAPSLCTNQ